LALIRRVARIENPTVPNRRGQNDQPQESRDELPPGHGIWFREQRTRVVGLRKSPGSFMFVFF
jgi:hypothetical protein